MDPTSRYANSKAQELRREAKARGLPVPQHAKVPTVVEYLEADDKKKEDDREKVARRGRWHLRRPGFSWMVFYNAAVIFVFWLLVKGMVLMGWTTSTPLLYAWTVNFNSWGPAMFFLVWATIVAMQVAAKVITDISRDIR